MGYLYEKDDALWFRSTDLGDDKDRVLVKANGEYTYFASDVAYHWNKFQRVDHVIDIWGADHHGYINRVRCVCDALGYPGKFEVLLGQLVNLLRSGKPVRMSKRRGTMITFRELLDEVGPDAARYTLISRSSNQMIDFDIDAVKEKSQDNPVYYVQYAHARVCSILRRGRRCDGRRGIRAGYGRGRCPCYWRERALRAAVRPHRARAFAQNLRAHGSHRRLRSRPRAVPPHALRRGAGR